MRPPLSRILFGAALAILTAAACGYDPNPESGTLKCGPSNTCPQNYSCMNGACWRDGAGGGTGTAGTTGNGGRGGTTGTGGASPADKFIGSWVYDATVAKRVRVCSDGTNETLAWNDYFNVTRGGPAPLRLSYYCDWDLDVDATGNATVIRQGTRCTHPDPNDATITYTWMGESLTLTTTNGTSGTLDMSFPYSYTTTTPPSSGTCTMHFTGPVTKN